MEFLRRFSICNRIFYGLVLAGLAILVAGGVLTWAVGDLASAAPAIKGRIDALAWTCGIVTGVLGACAVVGGQLLRYSVKGPVEGTIQSVIRLGKGDLDSKISSPGRDEISWMNAELNGMRKKLREMTLAVRDSSDSVSSASTELAAGNSDLSARTESQAAALQRAASSMSELATTVRENAGLAIEASRLVNEANEVAGEGGRLMHGVAGRMRDINTSAGRVAEITQVIDGIAFQTNILALNAAVESARAGEHGRGFAVVASEVRSLAQRSATAAREIKTLINESVEKATSGSQFVEQAERNMGKIVTGVSEVSRLVARIAGAGQAQSEGIEQVHDVIDKMDDMTQRNAALVEEAAAASQSLRSQSTKLTEAVSLFKIS